MKFSGSRPCLFSALDTKRSTDSVVHYCRIRKYIIFWKTQTESKLILINFLNSVKIFIIVFFSFFVDC